MKNAIIAIIASMFLFGCTDESAATRALRNEGFTEVRMTGWSPLSCGEDDFSSTGFEATNSRGQRVSGVVCCGMILKNCTVRW